MEWFLIPVEIRIDAPTQDIRSAQGILKHMADITITESAQTYLNGLLEKQNVDGIGVRLFVSQPGTMY